MAKIFVSSTFKDLEECRKAVNLQLRRMGHIDVAMEYFTAEDKRPLDKCLDAVDSSDLYIGIFAWRYGYIPPGRKRSMTELEYREAKKKEVECLIFLLDEEAPWPTKFVDDDKKKIRSLRDELAKKCIKDSFKTCDDLAAKVASAVSNWGVKHPDKHPADVRTGLDINSYAKAIEQKYKTLDLETLTPSKKDEYIRIQLSHVFVEQNVRERPPPVELPKEVLRKLHEEQVIEKERLPQDYSYEEIKKAKESYYSTMPQPVISAVTGNKYSVILGDPGSGKSTLARYILLSILNINQDERLNRKFNGYIPFLIELREFAALCSENKCTTFLDFFQVRGSTQGYHLTGDMVHKYLKDNGKALVMFDGLDEIFDPGEWENVNRMIAGFALDYPKAHIMVTSRIIGYKPKILDDAGFSHFTLQDFEEKHIQIFLDQWYSLALYDRAEDAKEKKERIIRSLKESSSIRQLAGNPLLLTILAIIGKHQELPRERWKLYEHAAGILLEHWDVNRHLKDAKLEMDFVGEEDKKELLRLIAYAMQSGFAGLSGNIIHKNDIRTMIQDYFEKRYRKQPADAKLIAEKIIDQFRERNFILCLHGADFYGFIHRTFLEYFCASAIIEKYNDHEIDLERLKNDFYRKYWEDQTWHEVLRLICGVKEKLAGDIIEFLMAIYNPSWFGKRMPWNIVLAVKVLSEIRDAGSISDTSKKLLFRIFDLFEKVRWIEDLKQFLGDEIVPAVKLVGKGWKQDNEIVEWIDRMNYGYYYLWGGIDYVLSDTWTELAAAIGSEEIYPVIENKLKKSADMRLLAILTMGKYQPKNEQIHDILRDRALNDKNDDVRQAAVVAIVQGWHDDPQTLTWLRDRALNDEYDDVRQAAVVAIAQVWHDDPQTLTWLCDLALNDENYNVRRAAVEAIAQVWHDDPQTLAWLCDLALNDENYNVRRAAVEAIAYVRHDDPQMLTWLRDLALNYKNNYVRGAAVAAIAQVWHDDPQTLTWLSDRALNDEYDDVRGAALRAIAQVWHDDPQTLTLLRDRALNDENDDVRGVAVEAIAQVWHDDPQTLTWLRDRVLNDEYFDVRQAAVEAMAQGWHDDPQTLTLLCDRALNDEYDDVRLAAVVAMAQGWHDDPQTLIWLRDRALNDENNYVRGAAVRAIAQGWHDDPQTLTLLRDRALNDKSYDARTVAVEAIAQVWHDDQETMQWLREKELL